MVCIEAGVGRSPIRQLHLGKSCTSIPRPSLLFHTHDETQFLGFAYRFELQSQARIPFLPVVGLLIHRLNPDRRHP